MKKIFLTLFVLCITASYGLCSTMNSYDSYGRKGSYIIQRQVMILMGGEEQELFVKHLLGIICMTVMEEKQVL